jgi:glutamate-1-semialdehyde 2,1-aminomutase
MEAIKKNIIAIVQARSGSMRFPNKVMAQINDNKLIEILFLRLKKSKNLNKIILATTDIAADDSLTATIKSLGFEVFRGSENNVLERYFYAASKYNATDIVRITGDCPLVDSQLVDAIIDNYIKHNLDYACNSNPPSYPDGLDIEIFSFSALKRTFSLVAHNYDKEHVTPFIRNSGLFKTRNFPNTQDFSYMRWTVDEVIDLDVIKKVFSKFYPDIYFKWQDVLSLNIVDRNIFINNYKRNEGALMSSGQKLWKRARNVIPGGNMLLSKRPEMFLPEKWPVYFSKSKGCHIWDLENNEYIDMSIMGIGTNILGYGHPEVDEAVHEIIRKGNMSTLNCPEEVYLAEKLVSLHPWADMVRFARSGGEANAIAIRIARAATGRDNVAVCGYHGWHDWYLSANLSDDKNLDGHLLPGLEPKGVPRNLKNSVFTFEYNNFNQLKQIVDNHNIGIIKMEVTRNEGPKENFLEKIRALATEKNIILIFDECTTGFREALGGIHKCFNVEPDMAMFGKALGNGYAISAVIGKREIMEACQSTFVSSTFWTERIGPTAALKTLEVMERLNSWEIITNIGKKIKLEWNKISESNNVKINQWGIPALAGYTINSNDALKYKTYITQEMLKKNFLVGNSIYVSIEHTEKYLNNYFNELNTLFYEINNFENDKKKIDDFLEGPICHSGFKRLN